MPCGCSGCSGDVAAFIAHPNGRRAVCQDHIGGYPVVEEVA
ncbi:MAG: hypothetical protein RI568_15820 [Natronomonas sp.]|nr:hypothetical protein [Natronomonas sp.]MDR9432149.1 hypothetical protein [Natronomonas sp.]